MSLLFSPTSLPRFKHFNFCLSTRYAWPRFARRLSVSVPSVSILSAIESVRGKLSTIRDLLSRSNIQTNASVTSASSGYSKPVTNVALHRQLERIKAIEESLIENENTFFLAKELLLLESNENCDSAVEAKKVMLETMSSIDTLRNDVILLETEAMFIGEHDSHECFMDIQAGAGGTESADWARMLLRMYSRWAHRRGIEYSVIDISQGVPQCPDGVKSVTLKLSGDFAFGWCRRESGVHRLVRLSPFDANARRHTSFVSVRITPCLPPTVIDIPLRDLKIDVYRSSGAGGQHVNTTESAVRITHLPTGITAQSQAQRSQHRNKDLAMDVLRSRVFTVAKKNANAAAAMWIPDIGRAGFGGDQIRSYILHPYQMIKDHSGYSSNDVDGILNGGEELDFLIRQGLLMTDHSSKNTS